MTYPTRALSLRTLALLALVGCGDKPYEDDTSSDDTSAIDDTSAQEGQSIEGDWLSEGEDVSPLFQSSFFNYVSISATFQSDGSYSVLATDQAGTTTTLEGTYEVDASALPNTIVLTQATPSAATAEGIWQLDGSTLTYEVVQVDPDYGFTAPTRETGFGSTSGGTIEPDANIQIYKAVE